MTRALPFTEASIARLAKGVARAGLFVIGVCPNGILLVGQEPLKASSLTPMEAHNDPASKWEDQGA